MKSPMRCGIRLLVGQRPSRSDYVRDLWLPTDSRRGAGGHPAGDRRRSVLMLPRLSSTTTLLLSMAGMQAV